MEHVDAVRAEQAVGVPRHWLVVPDQLQPYSPVHAVELVLELQGLIVPVHVVVQEQPDSPLHVVEVVFALHAVTVPVQVPVHEQPYAWLQVVDVVCAPQVVIVPVQGVDHVQPAFAQRVEDAYDVHVVGVPVQVLSALYVHPIAAQLTALGLFGVPQ